MANFRQLLMIGGPYDGWGQGSDDGFIDKGQKSVLMGPPGGSDLPDESVYVYLRDGHEYPDGRVRWFYDPLASREQAIEMGLLDPNAVAVSNTSGVDYSAIEREVRLTYIEQTDKWELWVAEDLIATCDGPEISDPDPEIQRRNANQFRASYISNDVISR